MEYSVLLFNETMTKSKEIHEQIMDMYTDTLYEDTWDSETIHKFDRLLVEYKKVIDDIDKMLPMVEWPSQLFKEQFYELYNEYLKGDYKSYFLTKVRHDAYLTYRTNRKALIKKLNKVVGFVKPKSGKDNVEVLMYFNEKLAKVPLYKNKDKDGKVTVKRYAVLANYLTLDINRITAEINEDISTEYNYEPNEVYKIFQAYVKCRLIIFKIFNMMTSSNRLNGYERWHNVLDKFCTVQLLDKNMEMLYDAANAETDFGMTDDYQLIMDDVSWNRKGVYEDNSFDYKLRIISKKHGRLNESWYDDEANAFANYMLRKADKRDIVKINMLSVDANACKVTTDGNNVYASTKFYTGDIVEICPTRLIDKSSMYSKDMREIVFEVIPNTEWVIPFGYCQFYESTLQKDKANCIFYWDAEKRRIIIVASKNIKKHEKLILYVVSQKSC